MNSRQVSVTTRAMHVSVSIALGVGLSFSAASANSLQIVNNNHTPSSSGMNDWTSERFQHARPLPIPTLTVPPEPPPVMAAPQTETSVTSGGRGPTIRTSPQGAKQLFEPAAEQTDGTEDDSTQDEIVPEDTGTARAHFSSSRLIPLSADRVYPYRTIGKLFFRIPGQGDFWCSASVIQRRLILTAGGCVHRGSGGITGFYEDFRFVPAYRNGAAPFLSWNWQRVTVTGLWATGGGDLPNAADYAIIEPQDRSSRRVGDVTGYLGWQTLSLHPNHVHMIGYAANLDFGRNMHQVAAASRRLVFPNNVEYGSDMREGSGGSPWIQNFGEPAIGQVGGLNPGENRVVGLTSYLPASSNVKVQGSSILNTTFVDLFNKTCADRFRNCD